MTLNICPPKIRITWTEGRTHSLNSWSGPLCELVWPFAIKKVNVLLVFKQEFK